MKNIYLKCLLPLLLLMVVWVNGNAQVIAVSQFNTSTGWSKNLSSAESVSFPTAAAGTSSFAFAIKNDGGVTLTLTGSPLVAVSGANAGQFSVVQPVAVSLAPGAATTFTVNYNPVLAFISSAQLVIASNAGSNFIINLKGGAFDFYGPKFPPIGTITTDSNGNIGRSGGVNLLITNVSLATKTQTYWGPNISSSGDLSLKVSLDNSTYTGSENLTFSSAESNLSNGQAVWRGSTFIQNAMTNSIAPVFIRATLTTRRPNNSVVPLVSPATLGLSEQVGGLVEFTALADFLVANYFIEASLNGASWQPYLDFYDAYPTPPGPLPGQGIGNAYSTVSNGFYWVNLGPRLLQNAILNLNEGATATIGTTSLNATDDEDMPATPASLVFGFATNTPGTSPLVFETGVLKKNGVVLTKTSTFTLADLQNNLITYEHSGNETVYDEFQFVLRDSKQKLAMDGPNSVFSFKFNIAPQNDVPQALNQNITTSFAGSYVGNLTVSDPDSTSFTYTIATPPAFGSISNFDSQTGAFTYTSTLVSPGSDSFTFTVNDGAATSNVATITFNMVNLPPTASDESFTTSEDLALSAALSGSDPEGSTVSFQLISQGTKGFASLNSNGSFTYSPSPSLFGTDSFTYRVFDVQGNQSPSYTVSISITPKIETGDILVVDGTLIRLYDTVHSQDAIITQGQGMADALNVCYKPSIGLFVYDKENGLISVNTTTGIQSLVAPSSSFANTPPIGGPAGMTFNSAGDIVLAGASGIVKVNPVTGVVTTLFSGGLLAYPTGVAYLSNGNLLVSDAGLITGGSSRIISITPAGVQTLISTGGLITLPLDFAIVDNNTIAVADAGSFAGSVDRIYKISLDTGSQTLLTTGGDLNIPSGIDYRANKLYVVNKEGTRKVLSIDSSTGLQSVISGTALNSPWGLMVVQDAVTPAPIAADQSHCQGSTIADLVATGVALQWYSQENGGSPLSSATILASGTYYVSQTIDSIESSRTSVEVTIIPSPTTSNAGANYSSCVANSSVTLAANEPQVGSGSWSVVSGPSTDLSQFSDVTSFNAIFTPSGGLGDYVLSWAITNSNCTSTSTSTLTVSPANSFYVDADGDGYGSGNLVAVCSVNAQTPPTGYSLTATDCNDSDASVNQTYQFYVDNDNDGFGAGSLVSVCAPNAATPPAGYSLNNTDCNDNNAAANAQFFFYVDADGDGFGTGTLVLACAVNSGTAPAGYSSNNTDCNDSNALTHATYPFYTDADGDGFGTGGIQIVCAVNGSTPPAGYSTNNSDCNDNNSSMHASFYFYTDNDNDGYGTGSPILLCAVNASTPPQGFVVSNNSDCDDNNAAIHQVFPFYVDADGDGYGTGFATGVCAVNATSPPMGYAMNNSDCNDNDASVHAIYYFYVDNDGDGFGTGNLAPACALNPITPPAGFSTNNTDCNDANPFVNQSFLFYVDTDNDGVGAGNLVLACAVNALTPPLGYSLTNTDCDNNNAAIFQTGVLFVDADNDGYTSGATAMVCYGSGTPSGYAMSNIGIDCDDNNPAIFQSATLFVDADNDGYTSGVSEVVCYGASVPSGYAMNNIGIDCNDQVAAINPGMTEILYNGIDDNCNGQLDEGFQILIAMSPSVCGTTLVSINSLISAVSTPNVSGYRFEVTNTATNAVQMIDRPTNFFSLTQLATYDYATTYSIRVMAQRNGIWLGYYGPSCLVSSPAILAPTGAAQVSASQCGITLPTISTLIATTSLPGVTGYRFRVTNISNPVPGEQPQVLDRNLHWFALTMLSKHIYGTTYIVEVAVKTNGVYSGYGSPCEVSTPAVPMIINCGQTMATSGTLISTISLNRVTSYRFEITDLVTQTVTTIDRSVHYFSFNMVPNYVLGGMYGVRVAVMTSGIYSPFGDGCEVIAPGSARPAEAKAAPFNAVAYPNPFSDTFNIDVTTSAAENISIKVYDMTGRLLETRNVAVSDITTQQVGERYPAGVYNVIVTQGEEVKTLRVVKR